MHEISLVEELVETVLNQAEGRPVARVVVRRASTLPPDSLREIWRLLVGGGPLCDATLETTEIERWLRCPCGLDSLLGHDDVMGALAICPRCHEPHACNPGAELELLTVAFAFPR